MVDRFIRLLLSPLLIMKRTFKSNTLPHDYPEYLEGDDWGFPIDIEGD